MTKSLLALPLLASLTALANAGEIRFDGNTVLDDELLGRIEIKLEQRDGLLDPDRSGAAYSLRDVDPALLTADGVAEVLRAISNRYQAQGILATRAEVTREAYQHAQQGGDLTVRVVEGRLAAVRVSDADGGSVKEATRTRILATAPLEVGGFVDGPALEHSLALVNRFSVTRVQPVLIPSPDGLELEYRVREGKRWSAGYVVDNFGSERTGSTRHQFYATATGLLEEDDRLSLAATLTSTGASRYWNAEYFAPLGVYHTHRARFSIYRADYTAEDIGVQGFDFEGKSAGAIAGYETTLWSGDGHFLDLSLGAHYLDASQDQSSVGVAYASASFLLPYLDLKLSRQSPSLSWAAGFRVEANLPELGGTDVSELDRLGRLSASEDFVIGRFYAGARAYLDGDGRVHEALANAALSSSLGGHRLPAAFLNAVGGHSSVRGYRVSAVSGDDSMYGQFEYRFHPLRRNDRFTRLDVAGAIFYDVGQAENRDPFAFESDGTLSAYGLGLHLSYSDWLNGSIEYALAAKDLNTLYESTEAGDSEVYVKGSMQF